MTTLGQKKKGLSQARILITCGPTWVPLDRMRVISNLSTGQLGQSLARRLASRGARVTLLEGPVQNPLRSKRVEVIKFQFIHELESLLNVQLQRPFECVIQAAAVADYEPVKPYRSKIASGSNPLQITLKPTRKLIAGIKQKAPQAYLVGFKLESTEQIEELILSAHTLFQSAGCDLVVANHFKPDYSGYLIDAFGQVLAEGRSREEMVKSLIKHLGKVL